VRSMFARIFVSFWISEILILVITGFLLRGHFDSPEVQHRSLVQAMVMDGNAAMNAYTGGGCPALDEFMRTSWEPSYLSDKDDHLVCQSTPDPDVQSLVRQVRAERGHLRGRQVGRRFLWGLAVPELRGDRWIFVISGAYPEQHHFPWHEVLPRLFISILVSGLVTLILALFLTRPISRLRAAARQLATGNLDARASRQKAVDTPLVGDELRGLVRDFDNMAERLQSMVDAQRLLLRDVSHELRSPLARLSVALELAREEAQPEVEEHLARMERETAQLNTLIGQLLSLSHMESAQRIADARQISLTALIDRLLPDAKYEAQRRNGTVQVSGAAPCPVQGDPELLYRALENIVRNAIAYTAENTTVEIALASHTADGQTFAVVRVMDRGPGVPEKELETIFRPFHRLDAARQRSTGGSGVGLAIADRAVRLHAGHLSASNRPGGGLIVEMRLPCATPPPAAR
jgi:two-component system sensor histidine kinase CpxA